MRSHSSYEKSLGFFQQNITTFPNIGLTKDQISDICAQIQCFFSDGQKVKRALTEFEKTLQAKWLEISKENNIDPNSFPFIKVQQSKEGLGLKWPIPDRRFTEDEKLHGLLNSTLLSVEQKIGINLPFPSDDERSPVPTFIGFVPYQEANNVVDQRRLWREEITFSGSLFHGKDTHRLHVIALLEASNLEILKLDSIKISFDDFLRLLIYTAVNGKSLWNTLLDNQANILANSKIDGTTCTNPFYFNNFMINAELPYLSSCVTKQFWTGLYKLNNFQKEIGYFLEPGLKTDQPVAHIISNPETWTIENTFETLLKSFDQGAALVTMDTKDVLIDYLKKGKLKEMPQLTTDEEQLATVKNKTSFRTTESGLLPRTVHTGLSVFKQKKTHRTKQNQRFVRDANKDDVIYGKELFADEIKWLKQNGYSATKIKTMEMSDIRRVLFIPKLEAKISRGNEEEILGFILNPQERAHFTSVEQIFQIAKVSDVAAMFLIKDNKIRNLFTNRDEIIKFIEQFPVTATYFKKDERINKLLISPQPI